MPNRPTNPDWFENEHYEAELDRYEERLEQFDRFDDGGDPMLTAKEAAAMRQVYTLKYLIDAVQITAPHGTRRTGFTTAWLTPEVREAMDSLGYDIEIDGDEFAISWAHHATAV